MDTWGIIIALIGGALYIVQRRRGERAEGWLFVVGIGVGLIVGAVWATIIVYSAF